MPDSTTKISTQRIHSKKKDSLRRSDLVDEKSLQDYRLVAGGKLRLKLHEGLWTLYAGANPVESHEDETVARDRYQYLMENKIAVGLLVGNAQGRENLGGFSGAGVLLRLD